MIRPPRRSTLFPYTTLFRSAVVTVTTAFSVWGYWLTGSWKMARRPSTRISRLTTAESTGRSTNKSVNFMGPASLLLRSRIRIVLGLHPVVGRDGRAVLQLELPARHDDVALLDTAHHRHLVAARGADCDESLLRHQ